MTQTVAEAQATLRTAEAALRHQQQEEAARQLREVRAQGHRVKRELDSTLSRFRRAQAEAEQRTHELTAANHELQAHAAARPDPADFPSDQDIERWQRELDRLVAARDRVVVRVREAQAESDRLQFESVRLDAALAQLRYAHTNAERKVRNEPVGGWWTGGVSPV